jgi:hypothetical protein
MRLPRQYYLLESVFRIRIRWIRMFFGLSDPDPLVIGMDPDPFIIKQKYLKNLYFSVL